MFNPSLPTRKLWKLMFVGSNWFFLKWRDSGKSNLSASECCQIYDLVGRKAVFRDGNTSPPQVVQEPQLLQAVELAGGSSTHHEFRHLNWTSAGQVQNWISINPSSNGGVYRIAQLMLQFPSCNANISIRTKRNHQQIPKAKMRPLIVVFHFRREWTFKSCFYFVAFPYFSFLCIGLLWIIWGHGLTEWKVRVGMPDGVSKQLNNSYKYSKFLIGIANWTRKTNLRPWEDAK